MLQSRQKKMLNNLLRKNTNDDRKAVIRTNKGVSLVDLTFYTRYFQNLKYLTSNKLGCIGFKNSLATLKNSISINLAFD